MGDEVDYVVRHNGGDNMALVDAAYDADRVDARGLQDRPPGRARLRRGRAAQCRSPWR
jgi:hypothetical protein